METRTSVSRERRDSKPESLPGERGQVGPRLGRTVLLKEGIEMEGGTLGLHGGQEWWREQGMKAGTAQDLGADVIVPGTVDTKDGFINRSTH